MKIQIAKIIFLFVLGVLKSTLDIIAFKVDKKSEDYKFYKKSIMQFTYDDLKKLFKQMEENKIIKRCPCKANLKQGYKDCSKCGGSGWTNNEE